MMTLLASLLISSAIAAGPDDFASSCLVDQGLTQVPVSGSALTLYRRCISKRRADAEEQQELDRRLQRLDQRFWRHKEYTNPLKERTEQQTREGIRTNQSRKSQQQQSGMERARLLRSVRGSLRRSFREKQQELHEPKEGQE